MEPGTGLTSARVAVAYLDMLGMRHVLRMQNAMRRAEELMQRKMRETYTATVSMEPSEEEQEFLMKLGAIKTARVYTRHIFDSTLMVFVPAPSTNSQLAGRDAVRDLAILVSRAIAANSYAKVLLRGAIAYGDCLLFADDQFVALGEPVFEAYEWEGRQLWSGAVLAPSAEAILTAGWPDDPVVATRPASFLARYDVPIRKDGGQTTASMIALDWGFWHDLMFSPTRPRMPRNPSSDVRTKIRNTQVFFDAMNKIRADEIAKLEAFVRGRRV